MVYKATPNLLTPKVAIPLATHRKHQKNVRRGAPVFASGLSLDPAPAKPQRPKQLDPPVSNMVRLCHLTIEHRN